MHTNTHKLTRRELNVFSVSFSICRHSPLLSHKQVFKGGPIVFRCVSTIQMQREKEKEKRSNAINAHFTCLLSHKSR